MISYFVSVAPNRVNVIIKTVEWSRKWGILKFY
jgi:hypothetical protein